MEPGRRIGGWEVVRELARGGQGLVLEVRDPQGRRGALKLLLQTWDDPRDLERLAREARLLAALPPHPGLPRLLDHGQDGGRPFVVLELVVGPSLQQLVASKGPLGAPQAVAFLLEAADAVAHLHAHGVLHRDLKPANLLLEAQTGRVVVVDLGLARRDEGGSLARLTRTGELLGTPAYMAPEQISPGGAAGEPGPAVDVYGLGATLYHLVGGRPPIGGATPLEVFHARLGAEPPRLLALRPELPAALDALCARCLAASPARRPASARDLIDELRRVALPVARARPRWPLVVAAGLLGLGGAVAGWLLTRSAAQPATGRSGPVERSDDRAQLQEQVRALVEQHRLDEALRVAEQAVARWPDDPGLLFARAVARGLKGDFSGACADLDRVLISDPDHTRARLNRGLALSNLGDPAGAQADFEGVLARDPRDLETWIALGQLCQPRDRPRARECFARALTIDPRCAAALVGRGELRLSDGDAAGAAADAASALEVLPGATEARFLRAKALHALRRSPADEREGLELLEGLIREAPRTTGAWAELAVWRAQRLEVADALGAVARWRQLSPDSLEAWRWTARIALLAEDESLAGEAVARLLAADPGDLAGLYARAALRRRQGDVPGALADLRQVLEREPDHLSALLERAVARFCTFDHAGSLADADRFLGLLTGSPGLSTERASAEVIRGQALFRLGRPGAEEAFQRAIEANPDLLEGWIFRAGMRVELGSNLDGARTDVREARRRLRTGARLTLVNRDILAELERALGVEPE